jgi:hypothetical protein
MYLHKPAELVIYPPPHHKDMIIRLYQNLGIGPQARTPGGSASQNLPSQSIVHIKMVASMSFALIEIVSHGTNILADIKGRLKELCLKKIEIINLYLNLGSPMIPDLVKELENVGFFFAGILPGAASGGDALILQYLNNVPIDYRKIEVSSEIAKDLVSYIMRHDPNRI